MKRVRPGVSYGASMNRVQAPRRSGRGHQHDAWERDLSNPSERDDADAGKSKPLAGAGPERGGFPVAQIAEQGHRQDNERIEEQSARGRRYELVAEGDRERIRAKENSPDHITPGPKCAGAR